MFASLSPAAADPGNKTDYLHDQAHNHQARLFAEDVQTALQSQSNFGGLRITSGGVEVSLVGSPASSERNAVTTAATNRHIKELGTTVDTSQAVPVTYRQVRYTETDLAYLTSRLDADQDSLEAAGVDMSSWGPDVVSNTVVAHLRVYSDAAAAYLQSRYGDGVTVATDSQTVAVSSSTADSTPWFGADKIDGPAGNYCTTWFSAKQGSQYVGVTAGHCGAGTWKQNAATYGTVSSRAYGGSIDGEIIPVASNGGYVWSGTGSSNRAVTAVQTSDPVGSGLCTDGYTDHEVCGITVQAVGQTVKYLDGTTMTGLVKAWNEGYVASFSPGDSGGPVYFVTSSGVTAIGMVDGMVTNEPYYGYYLPARVLISYFGITITTV